MPVITYEELRALDVVDHNDVLVGVVSDVAVDTVASDVYFVVVQPAGVLEGQGLGKSRFPVPIRAIQVLEDRLRLPWDAERISKAPRIAPDQPLHVGPEYATKIFGFWGVRR